MTIFVHKMYNVTALSTYVVRTSRPAGMILAKGQKHKTYRLEFQIFVFHLGSTVKPRKWRPRKWQTSLNDGWYLVLVFRKWRGKTSQNGGFSLEFLSNQYCYIIKVYIKLQVRLERTLTIWKVISMQNLLLEICKK